MKDMYRSAIQMQEEISEDAWAFFLAM